MPFWTRCSKDHEPIFSYGAGCPLCDALREIDELASKLAVLREQLDRRGIEPEI